MIILKNYKFLLVVFLSAISFRSLLFYSGIFDPQYITHDSWEYIELANSIKNDLIFGIDGIPHMNRTPGYPFFLALIYFLFTDSQFFVTSIQIILDSVVCVLIALFCLKNDFNKKVIYFCSFLSITCLYTSMYSYQVMTETLYTFLITFGFYLIFSNFNNNNNNILKTTNIKIIFSGLLFGSVILVRPIFSAIILLILIFLFVYIFLVKDSFAQRKKNILQVLIFSISISVIVVPWMTRNYILFNDEFKNNNNSATLLGYKTVIPTYRHWYTKEYVKFLRSFEEPFVQVRAEQPPVVVRYVYNNEQEDIKKAFSQLESEINAGDQPLLKSTLKEFSIIADKRYDESPRLYLTAPISRIIKMIVAPRISSLWKGTSGHNSSIVTILGFTLYNSIYMIGGLLGVLFGIIAFKTRLFSFSIFLILGGHLFIYGLWVPNTQSRYLIPLFPLMIMSIGFLINNFLIKKNRIQFSILG